MYANTDATYCSPFATACKEFLRHSKVANFTLLQNQANYVIQPNGNANIADNDVCTKLLITNQYWGEVQEEFGAILRTSLVFIVWML